MLLPLTVLLASVAVAEDPAAARAYPRAVAADRAVGQRCALPEIPPPQHPAPIVLLPLTVLPVSVAAEPEIPPPRRLLARRAVAADRAVGQRQVALISAGRYSATGSLAPVVLLPMTVVSVSATERVLVAKIPPPSAYSQMCIFF